ncbi:MAG: 3-hydroxyacyl-CoA dehydrogenase NAD-binding domain-containing protein [Bacteroidetes bacterium]|nr:3-hydroxyacyl-CoA dehydrogenase NAD-binding domain-containing protein [Bacteroidota bacterium]
MSERLEDFSLNKKIKSKGNLQKVGVVGAGAMGQEIALVVSQAGIDVIFIDLSETRVQEILDRMAGLLDEIINKWGMTSNEKKLILSRIKGSVDFNDLADCNIIIETINTKKKGTSIELRQGVFKKIEAVVHPDAVILSNTATLMISDLSSVLKHPERALGMHFISPVRKVKIAEVVRTFNTSDVAYNCAAKFAKLIGKTVIDVGESPGNITTRSITVIINEACEILMEGIATVSDIDLAMREGYGLQFGPLEMADRIGLDKVLRWMDNLYDEFGALKYKPSPLIKRMVRANLVGKRVGEGFYKYGQGKKQTKAGSIRNLGRL